MIQFKCLLSRNIKLFFKDKGMFITALITPMILLVLYATFLGNVYKNSFLDGMPEGITIADSIIDGLVASQLMSSILAVSCVTVSFCANMIMIQDKANGTIKDFTVSPVKPSVLAFAYYFASLIVSLIICLSALALCLGYVAISGWYLTFTDVLLLILDVFILVMFGTALSSLLYFFLSTQGQMSAVGTIISSVYGFICGAYMPISQFPQTLQKVLAFLPGTYGTVLVRNHSMNGAFNEMINSNIPEEVVTSFKDVIDCNISIFDTNVSIPTMYIILLSTIAIVVSAYVLINKYSKKAK